MSSFGLFSAQQPRMQHRRIILVILVALFAVVISARVSPIWMAPTNLNYPQSVSDNVFENFTANLGDWATIEVATGSRGNRPLVLVDSKGILWILGGVAATTKKVFLTAVWNYNPKTDQYRYVWKTNDSSPFVARNPGELHVADPSNHPGGIGFTAGAIDKDDNIWFYSLRYSSELWMFNTTSWEFVRQFGLYGVNDKPSLGATPGQPGEDVWPGRYLGQCMAIDSQQNVWMLSGSNGNENINTVWHFNTTSLLWTYITGSTEQINARHNATFYGGTSMGGCDIDDNDRVWIYGGNGASDTLSNDYGHLWTFDTRVKKQWEFEYGADAFKATPQVVSNDFNADNRPPAGEGCGLIDRRDGTLMLVPGLAFTETDNGATDTIWLYSKSLKQWKLAYGNIFATNLPGNYSNYRAPGSATPGFQYFGYNAGKNSNGDFYLVGGSLPTGGVGRKDIWLIPRDRCSKSVRKCDVNADCIEEIAEYSCKCKSGFTGDGFTCTAPPVDVPISIPGSINTPSKKTSSASLVSSSIALATLVVVL